MVEMTAFKKLESVGGILSRESPLLACTCCSLGMVLALAVLTVPGQGCAFLLHTGKKFYLVQLIDEIFFP